MATKSAASSKAATHCVMQESRVYSVVRVRASQSEERPRKRERGFVHATSAFLLRMWGWLNSERGRARHYVGKGPNPQKLCGSHKTMPPRKKVQSRVACLASVTIKAKGRNTQREGGIQSTLTLRSDPGGRQFQCSSTNQQTVCMDAPPQAFVLSLNLISIFKHIQKQSLVNNNTNAPLQA